MHFSNMHFVLCPKDPAVLKTLRDSELLRRSVFTTPPSPYLLRCEPLFEGKCLQNPGQLCRHTGGIAIANHCAIVNLLRVVNVLRRSIFSTAGSFGCQNFGLNSPHASLPCLLPPAPSSLLLPHQVNESGQSRAPRRVKQCRDRGPPTIYRHHKGLSVKKGISKGVVYKLSEPKRTAK